MGMVVICSTIKSGRVVTPSSIKRGSFQLAQSNGESCSSIWWQRKDGLLFRLFLPFCRSVLEDLTQCGSGAKWAITENQDSPLLLFLCLQSCLQPGPGQNSETKWQSDDRISVRVHACVRAYTWAHVYCMCACVTVLSVLGLCRGDRPQPMRTKMQPPPTLKDALLHNWARRYPGSHSTVPSEETIRNEALAK